MRLDIWRILAFPDYTLTLTLFQENNHAKLTLFLEALIHFVAVKRSRREKYFFLIYFFKSRHEEHFWRRKLVLQKWTQYRVYFFLPFRVHFYNSINLENHWCRILRLNSFSARI